MSENSLLKLDEVAEILKVHPRTVRKLITDGELVACRVGGGFRVFETDLQRFFLDNLTDQSVDDAEHKTKGERRTSKDRRSGVDRRQEEQPA